MGHTHRYQFGFFFKKKSPIPESRVPETGSDPPIGSGRGSGQGAAGKARTRWGARTGAGVRGRRAGGRARQERAAGRRGAREAHVVGARGARPGRAWAHLVHWLGQFGAHAASLGFDLGF